MKNCHLYLNRYIIRAALVWALMALHLPCSAQSLSLYEAVERSLANYPLLKQRQSEMDMSAAHVTTMKDMYLPSLKLHEEITNGTDNGVNGAYFPLSTVPSLNGGIHDANNSAAATGNIALSLLEVNLYNFGYNRAETRNAQAGLATSKAYLNREKYLLTENVVGTYLDLLKQYRLLQIEKENTDRAGTILNVIRANVNSGLKPGVDSSTASAEYARAQIAYLDALDRYQGDQLAIASYTALSRDKVQPDTTLFSAAVLQTGLQVPVADSVSLSHPLLDAYEQQYLAQLTANTVMSKKYLPKINLEAAAWMRGSGISSAGDYSANSMDGLGYNRYNYLFGLAISYNIFDLKHRSDLGKEGQYAAQAKQSALQTQQQNLNNALQQVNEVYANTQKRLQALPIQLNASQQAYNQQLALYHSGLNTLIELTNAQYALRQAETAYVLAQDDLLRVLYLRAGLNNHLDEFLQTLKH